MEKLSGLAAIAAYISERMELVAQVGFIEAIIVLLTVSAVLLLTYVPLTILRNQTKPNTTLHVLFHTVRLPLVLLATVYTLLVNLGLLLPVELLPLLHWADSARLLLVNVTLLWIVLRYLKLAEERVGKDDVEVMKDRVSSSTIKTSFFIARLVVFGVFGLLLLQELGVSINSILAFGGVSGIIVGYATRDFLNDIFSGLRIFLYRPFEVGDWVKCPSEDVEGVVEAIGWMTTQIRTFDKRPVYVPNSLLALRVIHNPQRMSNYRIYERFGVRYEDIGRLATVLTKVRAMLEEHPGIDKEQIRLVNFDHFGDFSIDCFIYCMSSTTVWAVYHNTKEDVLLRLASIVAECDADFAFPTRTVHIEPKDHNLIAGMDTKPLPLD